jgi:hypothetical protein
MDVVDTLRHREHVITRELNEEAREADLLARLKTIYEAQGIEVTERILKEGVQGLKEQRFAYDPPAPGIAVGLARAYVARWRIARIAGAAALGIALVWSGYTFGYRLPAERAVERARTELAEQIPARLAALAEEVGRVALDGEVRADAEELRRDGVAGAAAGDRDEATAALAALEKLHTTLLSEYAVRIVQGEGEESGVWRIPDVNEDARNYYLIVEAVTPDGSRLEIPIESEETGKTAEVSRWGQRVTEAAFDRVRRDKLDDGIIQDDTIGGKRRGELEPDFTFPVENGAITEW